MLGSTTIFKSSEIFRPNAGAILSAGQSVIVLVLVTMAKCGACELLTEGRSGVVAETEWKGQRQRSTDKLRSWSTSGKVLSGDPSLTCVKII
jgi:hypothetical protein